LSAALAFRADGSPLDYGARLSRLRWRRATGAREAVEWQGVEPAADVLSRAPQWLVVLEPSALPLTDGAPEAPAGHWIAAGQVGPRAGVFVHTLRELEAAAVESSAAAPAAHPAAVSFRAADFPAAPGETIGSFLDRLVADAARRASDSSWRVVRLDEPSDRERAELTRRLPDRPLRVLDVGCGAGNGIAGARPARGARWAITGIEQDPGLAARARTRCDRVCEGDLTHVLPALARDGERFDALVFADVLEHLEDPVAALAAGHALAETGARLLVSVPNVGHLSVVRDLVLGRFDPVPAGLADARHLRWFTRGFLEECLREAGWSVVSVESEPGAPAPDAAAFLAQAAQWPDVDLASLATYQWIAEGAA
jgi:SAM-dependent methyltransferase